MTGLPGESTESSLRITRPTKVVTVSMWTSPIVSSFITLVELTLEMPGVATNPIDIGPTDISLLICMISGALRQDVTSVNPLGGVGGLTKANAFDRGEDTGTSGVLNRQDGRAAGAVRKST